MKIYNAPPGFEMNPKGMAEKARRQHELIKEMRNALKLIVTSSHSSLGQDYCKGIARAALAKAEAQS